MPHVSNLLNMEVTSEPLPKSESEEKLMANSEVARNICPKLMLDYDLKLQADINPEIRFPVAKKILECYSYGIEKVAPTPCEEIRATYQKCLKEGDLYKHTECYHLKDVLGKCVVKHVAPFE